MITQKTASDQGPEDWRIICDFDGTITPFDVTDALLQRFAHPSWEDVEEQWLGGKITARECMDRQVRLLNVPRHVLDGFLDTVPVVDGFVDFAHNCASQGISLTVVSDGLDYAIRRILSRHGVSAMPIIANRLRCLDESTYRLEFPYGIAGCASGVCKCAVGKAMGGKILLIGDGHSDCCVAGVSALVLARQGKKLQQHCETDGYPHLIFADFHDVATCLEKITRHAPAATTPAEARAA
ncbi:MAG: HAD-IB family phosphatase [Desulfobulbus sp.]|nr:HAD-IB family phosphatase [Desulfobulbus sp.]